MAIEDFIGASKPVGFFDPLKLSEGKDDSTLNWWETFLNIEYLFFTPSPLINILRYRAAELKHGRVAMLASLGVIIQGLDTKIIPGFPVTNTNAFTALKEVYYANPGALIQVCKFILIWYDMYEAWPLII